MSGTYDLLPRSSSDLDEDYKPPLPRRRFLSYPSLHSISRKARRVCRPLNSIIAILVLLICQVLFNASYTSPPSFFADPDETVFIAANIIKGDLISGAWGKSLLELVEEIGRDRVFVSIYGGPTKELRELEEKLEGVNKNIVSEEEEPIDLRFMKGTQLPTGEWKIKRIAYLAEVRNKVLKPFEGRMEKRYDKVLFINDVFFSPKDAMRLLWGTNVNKETGKAEYKAVCGADFVTSWKYYDTYATRDMEGYSLGVPIFPWFANEGEAMSRKDVIAGKDAVRVKSCWGGMVAFDGQYFQRPMTDGKSLPVPDDGSLVKEGDTFKVPEAPKIPLRFRFEPEPFWDASECCLIHADIMALAELPTSEANDSQAASKGPDYGDGIFINPYVRVAYDSSTFSRIWFAKRFERLLIWPQSIISRWAGMPRHNVRREEKEGEVIQDRVWIYAPQQNLTAYDEDEPSEEEEFGGEASQWQGWGHWKRGMGRLEERGTAGEVKDKEYWEKEGYYKPIERVAQRGGYCGVRQLLVLKDKEKWGEDEDGNWDNMLGSIPPP